MKRYLHSGFSLLFLLLGLPILLSAQEAGVPDDTSTVITSDTFRLDLAQHQGVFTDNVVVTSKDFHMKANEMTVFFSQTGGNKVEHLLARGDVQIDTDGRQAKSTQAEYVVADDTLVLTGAPVLVQNKDTITGTKITLFRHSNRMEVEGRSHVVLSQDTMSTAKPPASAPAGQ